MKFSFRYFAILACLSCFGCKTRGDLKREQDYERIKQEANSAKTTRADFESVSEDLRAEMHKVQSSMEEQLQLQRMQDDEIKKEILALQTRIQALEQKAVADDAAARSAAVASAPSEPAAEKNNEKPAEKRKVSFENAKKLFDEEKYEDAAEMLKGYLKKHSKGEDAKKAHFLLADCHFASGEFVEAALEYAEFKKKYSKDALVANATYKQAQSFKNIGKKQEATLFYQELIERFPKNPLAQKAKQEMKKLK